MTKGDWGDLGVGLLVVAWFCGFAWLMTDLYRLILLWSVK